MKFNKLSLEKMAGGTNKHIKVYYLVTPRKGESLKSLRKREARAAWKKRQERKRRRLSIGETQQNAMAEKPGIIMKILKGYNWIRSVIL